MSKTILLVAGQSKEELDLASILKEINYHVYVASDSNQIMSYLQTHPVHMAIAFERVLLLESASYEMWVELLKKKQTPILWTVSPAFMREHQRHIEQKHTLWPFDLDAAIDHIEKTIGLPSPPEENTQKISEAEVNDMILNQKKKMDQSHQQQENIEKKHHELLRKFELMQEEVKKLKSDLKKEKDLVLKAKQLLQQTLEILK